MPLTSIIVSIAAVAAIIFYIRKKERGFALRDAGCALVLGVGFNLALLGYYKYTNFFIDSLNAS